MFLVCQVVFWLFFLLFLQTWFFYPAALRLYVSCFMREKHSNRPGPDEINLPAVSVILPVHNAEDQVLAKLRNLLELDYPRDRLEILVVSDGSTDATVEQVRSTYGSQVRLIDLVQNQGKSTVQNKGFELATHSILLLTDVDASLDRSCLRNLVGYFDDATIGCVGANVRFKDEGWEASGSHNIFWGIEETSRMAESELGTLISVCGSAFAVRKEYLRPLDSDTGDDFIIPLDMALKGQRTVFAADALAYDHWPSKNFRGELRTRRRITLRNLLALMRRRRILNPLRFPRISLSLISHKLLRWLSPALMIAIFVLNVGLAEFAVFYRLTLAAQVACYLLASMGILASSRGRTIPVLSQLGSFLWSNIGMLWGLISLAKGNRIYAYTHVDATRRV